MQSQGSRNHLPDPDRVLGSEFGLPLFCRTLLFPTMTFSEVYRIVADKVLFDVAFYQVMLNVTF